MSSPHPELVEGRGRTRRGLLAGAFALAACEGRAQTQAPSRPVPRLRDLAPFPIGTAVMTARLNEPAFAALAARQFSQITPEWELKMEYVLRDDGSFRFDAPDRIAAFARANRQRFYGTTLVWYSQDPVAFRRLEGRRQAFADAYRNYILAVAGRYRGQAVAWDVVNEPVTDEGSSLREHLWSRNLGQIEHMELAFQHAKEADPNALRVLNEYNLESNPTKRRTFLRLVETLLGRGTPVTCVGTQSHLTLDLPRGALRETMRELAAFGLPIHVSELDVSMEGGGALTSTRELLDRQARLVGELLEAFYALPERQRFAFTLWGVRDRDSWLRGEAGPRRLRPDQPLLFDDDGAPKPAFWAMAERFGR